MARIAVLGAGYVGLTSAAGFAHLGHEVVCADVVAEKVERLSRGEIPIVETGLEQLVAEGLRTGRLRFVLGPEVAAEGAEFVFLCVPTPKGPSGGADLSYIESAAASIAPVITENTIVVNKSTVPVGSTKVVERALKRPEVKVVSNPEFLREGSAVHDFLHPDRVVVGCDDQAAAVKVASLYLGVPTPIIVTNPSSAETIKYAANAFLATKVSFANAVAAVCESVGADVNDVMLGIGYDKRIGPDFLKPGPGWGGSCLPKDTLAMVHIADSSGYDFDLLRGVIKVNDDQRRRVIDKIRRAAGGSLAGAKVAVWGLAFKAGTDDVRDSPSFSIIERLVAAGAVVRAHDPVVTTAPPAVEYVADPYAVCEGADALVLLTEWDSYRWLEPEKLAETMARPAVVDARNLLDRAAWMRAGFTYEGIGR
jgi:UDPglucose 6-dehydrogenase